MESTLLVTDIFPPDIGGPATFIEQLAHHLARDGHAVTVVCTSVRPHEAADRARPFRVHRIGRRARSPAHSLRVRAVLAAEVLRHRHILCNGLEYPTYQVCSLLRRPYVLKVVGDAAWEAARNLGLTHLSIHEFQATDPAGTAWEGLVRKRTRFVRGAAMVITPSDYLRRMVIAWRGDAAHAVTVHNGVPLGELAGRPLRRRAGGPFEVLFVGRLAGWKGVDTLLEAAAGLAGVHVTVAGDGPERAALAVLAERLGMAAAVTFTGALPRAAVQAQMAQAHVLVLASSYEGLSHTLLEASALGTPCIASDCGGNPEVIRHMENGLLVPYGDVAALRTALARLQHDEALRSRLAQAARESSRRFDFEGTVAATARILLAR